MSVAQSTEIDKLLQHKTLTTFYALSPETTTCHGRSRRGLVGTVTSKTYQTVSREVGNVVALKSESSTRYRAQQQHHLKDASNRYEPTSCFYPYISIKVKVKWSVLT